MTEREALMKLAGVRNAKFYITFYTYLDLSSDFLSMCKAQNIRLIIIDACDKRRNKVVHIQQDDKCDKS